MVWHGRTLASLPSARLTIASGSITSPRVRVSDLTGCGAGSFCRSADPVPHTCPTSECVPEFGLWLGRRITRGCICSGLRCVECRCAKARKRAIEMCLGRLRGPHSYARSHFLRVSSLVHKVCSTAHMRTIVKRFCARRPPLAVVVEHQHILDITARPPRHVLLASKQMQWAYGRVVPSTCFRTQFSTNNA
jgi:hypothetical protein